MRRIDDLLASAVGGLGARRAVEERLEAIVINARMLVSGGQPDAARKLLSDIARHRQLAEKLKCSPEVVFGALLVEGSIRQDLGSAEQARTLYTKARGYSLVNQRLYHHTPEAEFLIGTTFEMRGDHGRAIQCYLTAIRDGRGETVGRAEVRIGAVKTKLGLEGLRWISKGILKLETPRMISLGLQKEALARSGLGDDGALRVLERAGEMVEPSDSLRRTQLHIAAAQIHWNLRDARGACVELKAAAALSCKHGLGHQTTHVSRLIGMIGLIGANY